MCPDAHRHVSPCVIRADGHRRLTAPVPAADADPHMSGALCRRVQATNGTWDPVDSGEGRPGQQAAGRRVVASRRVAPWDFSRTIVPTGDR
ncbi:hypothetical protein GCM10027072_79210 [Streptomyces bullii]